MSFGIHINWRPNPPTGSLTVILFLCLCEGNKKTPTFCRRCFLWRRMRAVTLWLRRSHTYLFLYLFPKNISLPFCQSVSEKICDVSGLIISGIKILPSIIISIQNWKAPLKISMEPRFETRKIFVRYVFSFHFWHIHLNHWNIKGVLVYFPFKICFNIF